MISLITLVKRQCLKEILLHVRQLRQLVNSSLFFLMVTVFFPLTMPPDTSILRTIAPGLIWIALLLAMLLAAEYLFQQDYEDGVIEQWLVCGYPLSLLISAKVWVHWLLNLLPILLLCPLLAILLALTPYETIILVLALIFGSPAILFLCALASAFGTGLKQRGVFMALILLPLTIPIMMFGSGVVTAAMQGLPVQGYLALILAISLVASGLLPFAVAGVIRIGLVD